MSLDEYLKVKTGQDLIDLGVIPKDSSAHLALIAYKRLRALKDRVDSGLSEDIVGKWTPLFDVTGKDSYKEVPNPDLGLLKEGMEVRAVTPTEINGKTGRIVSVSETGVVVDFQPDAQILNRENDLTNRQLLLPSDIIAYIPDNTKKEYEMIRGVVVDEKLGHRVLFPQGFSCVIKDEQGNKLKKDADKLVVNPNTKGTLRAYDPKKGFLKIFLDEKIGSANIYTFNLEDIAEEVQVSSLGQIDPPDREKIVMEKTLEEFFPTTRLETERTYRALVALILGKDMIFYGPPGSGKSNLAKDIVRIAKQQKVSFVVEGCKVQCNPFSLFDKEFSQIVPACPECLIKYCPEYKTTGRFTMQDPRDVKVTPVKYTEGYGIETAEGTRRLSRLHLAGFKIPNMVDPATRMMMMQMFQQGKMDKKILEKIVGSMGSDENNEFDPEGFHPGSLTRTNNGIFFIDEIDKMAPDALDNLLKALNDSKIKPDELRFEYPSNTDIIATANDPSVFSDALCDRMFLLAIRYSGDVDVNNAITRVSYHNQFLDIDEVPVENSHKEKRNVIRNIPMPSPIEKAVEAMYIKFRNEYSGTEKQEIMGSRRSTNDALDVARAQVLIDQVFFANTPKIANAEYARKGMQFAVCARVREYDKKKNQQSKANLNKWVQDNFDEAVKSEENTWWCRAYKHISIARTIVPEIEENFSLELKTYTDNPSSAIEVFKKMKEAYETPSDVVKQKAKVQFPFMDYLFIEQPRMKTVKEEQIPEFIAYYMKSKENVTCEIK